jgi:hypothetical protein
MPEAAARIDERVVPRGQPGLVLPPHIYRLRTARVRILAPVSAMTGAGLGEASRLVAQEQADLQRRADALLHAGYLVPPPLSMLGFLLHATHDTPEVLAFGDWLLDLSLPADREDSLQGLPVWAWVWQCRPCRSDCVRRGRAVLLPFRVSGRLALRVVVLTAAALQHLAQTLVLRRVRRLRACGPSVVARRGRAWPLSPACGRVPLSSGRTTRGPNSPLTALSLVISGGVDLARP